MQPQKPTIKTIAKEAGVSTTTVHRSLSNTGRISPATRKRVLAVAKRLGYRPNRLARGLRTQRSASLGAVVPFLDSYINARLLNSIERTARQRGYFLLLGGSHFGQGGERAVVESLLEAAAEGLIVWPSVAGPGPDYFNALVAQGCQIVFVDRYLPDADVSWVCTDNLRGGYLAANHLARLGRKRIAFLSLPSYTREATSVHGRLRGCQQALQEAGLEPPMVLGPDVPDTDDIARFGYEAVRAHLLSGPPVDALFAAGGYLVHGALQALEEHSVRVPEDVSVVTFDDPEDKVRGCPALTAIEQPMHEMGGQAVRLLLDRIERSSTGRLPRQEIVLQPRLIVRDSCGGQPTE